MLRSVKIAWFLITAYAGMAPGLSDIARAADFPAQPNYPPPPAPATYVPVTVPSYSWSGFYLGIEGGWAWGTTSSDVSNGRQGTGNFDLSGGLLGGTVGFNWQASSWIFGLEGDGSWANKNGSANEIAPFIVTTVNTITERWLATGRVRIGYSPVDWSFAYVTGGVAVASVAANLSNSTFGLNETDTLTRYGWTVGGGAEVRLVGNLSAKAEYLFVQLNNPQYSWPQPSAPGTVIIPTNFPVYNNIVRGGLNYRF